MVKIKKEYRLKSVFIAIGLILLFRGLAYSEESLRLPMGINIRRAGETITSIRDIVSRVRIYNLNKLKRCLYMKSQIKSENLTEWRRRRWFLPDGSVNVEPAMMAVVELRDDEDIVTKDLCGCMALIGRGRRKNGQYIYFLAHITPIFINEHIDAVTSILKSYSLEEIEVYFDVYDPNEMLLFIYFNRLQQGLKSEHSIKVVTDFSKNSWREKLIIGNVIVNKKGFIFEYKNVGFGERQPLSQVWKTKKRQGNIENIEMGFYNRELRKNI